MAIFGALLLVFVIVVRPQEFIAPLKAVSPPNLATAVALLGIVYEMITARRKVPVTPQAPLVGGFFLWAVLATTLRLGVRGALEATWMTIGQSGIIMVVIALATRTFTRFRALAILVMTMFTLICAVCVHQAQQTPQCIAFDKGVEGSDVSDGEPDGRVCESAYLCSREGDQKLDYDCEKVGLFGTTTQGLRVRWRGTLGDPNELALFVGTSMPLLFALASVSRRKIVTVAIGALIALGLVTVVLSGSRGGQLVVLTVLGLYFVRRYGIKGLIVGAALAMPLLLFGGREGEEAESSSQERIELLYEGIDMIKAYPFAGVGIGEFQEHMANHLTAHNSYLLSAAELGLPGCLLWSLVVYMSIKIPFLVASRPPILLDKRMVTFATALCVSYAGMLVGIFFLSFCYKQWLFMFFGLSGALYASVKQAHPEFMVRVGWKEAAWILAGDVMMLILIYGYSRAKIA